MVDGGAAEIAEHIHLGRGHVRVDISREDDVPKSIQIVELWSPQIV